MPLVAHPPAPPSLPSLLTAEHAFARHARERDTSSAFVAAYHPEGLIFAPRPVPGGPTYAARKPDGSRLLWGPAHAWAARSSDLGFTTGPWTWHAEPGAPASRQGWFVSVWIREADGPWKLYWDLGTPNPPEPRPPTLLPDPGRKPEGAAAPPPGPTEGLLARDRALGLATAKHPGEAYRTFGSRELRIHRSGAFPASGLAAALDLVRAVETPQTGRPEAARVSAAGDLGCTRGTLLRGDQEKGAYVRLWRREGDAWRLLLDVVVPY